MMTNTETATMENFETALNTFVATVQDQINAHFAKNYPRLSPDVLSIDNGGRKYVRIVESASSGCGRRVFCFVEKATGRVLKAASWKAPAKHARGTIFTADPKKYGVTVYGAQYLR